MPSIRSTLTYASGLLGSLLIAGSIMVCQHCGAAAATDEHKPPPAPGSATAVAKTAIPPKKAANGPSWQALTTAQQLALVPLAGEWDSMDSLRKEKWIAIGNRYARMSPAEQNRIQTRMRDWIKLTPEQRRTVRQSYASTKKWDADQKSAQWQQYLQLSDEQKAQLAKQKLSQIPVTAVTRAKPKPKPLLPIPPEPARAGVSVGAGAVPGAAIAPTASATPAQSAPATAAVPAPPQPLAPVQPAAGNAIAPQPNNK
jgi:hypothetical protein